MTERLPYDLRLQIGRALDRLVCDESTPQQVDQFIETFAAFGLTVIETPTSPGSTPILAGRAPTRQAEAQPEEQCQPDQDTIATSASLQTLCSQAIRETGIGHGLHAHEGFSAARSSEASEVDGLQHTTKEPPQTHLTGIAAFERAYPDFFWRIGKGRVAPDEPLYGAIIETQGGSSVGEGESNISLGAAFAAAFADSGLPIPPDYPTVTKVDVIRALEILGRANGADLDQWTAGILPCDEIRDALRAALATEGSAE